MVTAAKRYAYGRKVAHVHETSHISQLYQPSGYTRHCGRVVQFFGIQTAVEVDGCNNVLKSRYDPLNSGDVLLLKGERGRGCRGLSRWRRWSSRSGGCTTLGWNLGEEVDV
jgi:hypothetical protein